MTLKTVFLLCVSGVIVVGVVVYFLVRNLFKERKENYSKKVNRMLELDDTENFY